VGRQAAKIRCRKCEYLIQIAYRGNTEEFDVTATPPTVAPPAPSGAPAPLAARAPKAAPGQPAALSPGGTRPRLPPPLEEGSASKKPTAAVPGLPGLGSAKGARGAALFSDPPSLSRRPLAPLPPPPVTSTGIPAVTGLGTSGLGSAPPPNSISPSAVPSAVASSAAGVSVANGVAATGTAISALPSPPPPRPAPSSTQLGDQFRESVQAGAAEDLPQEGWFVGVNGVPLGPIPLVDLRELAMAGHIDRRSLVWREGQGEWRPLGKFPGLVRVIDDGAAPASVSALVSPLPEAPSGPPPRSNGANGQHVATGFDVVRAETGERPSVWGDLDDEDDEDEQPTTVKGRVSVLPPPGSLPGSELSIPPPRDLPSSVPAASNASPYGLTASVRAVPAPAPAPSGPPGLAQGGGMTATGMPAAGMMPMSAPPVGLSLGGVEPMLEGYSPLRAAGRVRWYLLIAAAVVVAFALGAAAMQWMAPSTPEQPGKSSALGAEGAARPPPPPPPKGAPKKAAAPAPPAAGAAGAAGGGSSPSRVVLPPGVAGAPSGPASSIPAPVAKVGAPTGSLLAGIGSPQTPGPTAAPRSDAPPPAPAGLDATAVQRTVRRYSPTVRQSCWQRALSARAPGTPTSAKVSATITIDASGRVQAVSVAGAPRGYPNLARCIETSVKSWQFPRAATQTVTNVPFMFVGQ